MSSLSESSCGSRLPKSKPYAKRTAPKWVKHVLTQGSRHAILSNIAVAVVAVEGTAEVGKTKSPSLACLAQCAMKRCWPTGCNRLGLTAPDHGPNGSNIAAPLVPRLLWRARGMSLW